jgi:hypothetical protein
MLILTIIFCWAKTDRRTIKTGSKYDTDQLKIPTVGQKYVKFLTHAEESDKSSIN